VEEEEEEELTTTLGMFLAPRVEFGPPRPSRNVATTRGGKATTLQASTAEVETSNGDTQI